MTDIFFACYQNKTKNEIKTENLVFFRMFISVISLDRLATVYLIEVFILGLIVGLTVGLVIGGVELIYVEVAIDFLANLR